MPVLNRHDLFTVSASETMSRWENLSGKISVRQIRGFDSLFSGDRWKVEWTDILGAQHSRVAPSLAKLRAATPFAFRLRARRTR